MRSTGGGSGRWLARCLVCCVTALVGAVGAVGVPAVASAGTGTSSSPSASSLSSTSSLGTAEGSGASAPGGASSPLAGALVIAGSPTQGEQAQAVQAAQWASPQARVARERSRTEFAGLGAGAAAKLAREAFPGVVDQPAGGPPSLPAGERIVGYPTDHAAQVELAGGKHGVIESLQPLVVESSQGRRTPVDLGLREDGSSFAPTTALVGVSIPKRLSDGVTLAGAGVSLTPVDVQGSPLGGAEGSVDGASVLYANTQSDADTLVKPTTLGFEADTVLRSVDSPERLYFRVGMPAGASLEQAKDGKDGKGGSGAVQVVDAGTTIATVLPPSAQDAAGTLVPVSMTVSGDTLVLSVDRHSTEYQYPIEVDPEFKTVTDSTLYGAWSYVPHGEGFRGEWINEWLLEAENGPSGQWAELSYLTNGDSRIYKLNTVTQVSPTYFTEKLYFNSESRIYLEGEKKNGDHENNTTIATPGVPIENSENQLCTLATNCGPEGGSEGNLVRLADERIANVNSSNQVRLKSATVSISQPASTHSTMGLNTGPQNSNTKLPKAKRSKLPTCFTPKVGSGRTPARLSMKPTTVVLEWPDSNLKDIENQNGITGQV